MRRQGQPLFSTGESKNLVFRLSQNVMISPMCIAHQNVMLTSTSSQSKNRDKEIKHSDPQKIRGAVICWLESWSFCPTTPTCGARFTPLTGGARPTTPTQRARFTTPTGGARSTTPTGEARTTTPTGGARFTTPTGEARTTTPTGEARTTTPTGGARFTTPTGGSQLVLAQLDLSTREGNRVKRAWTWRKFEMASSSRAGPTVHISVEVSRISSGDRVVRIDLFTFLQFPLLTPRPGSHYAVCLVTRSGLFA